MAFPLVDIPASWGRRPALVRFFMKIEFTESCWFWTGARTKKGYGHFLVGERLIYAHRYAYILGKGEIPAGLHIDHVCHNADAECAGSFECKHRRCVNPDHLEAVTNRVNVVRGRRRVSAPGVH